MRTFFPRFELKREIARQHLDSLKLSSRKYEGGKVDNYHKAVVTTNNPNEDMQVSGVNMRKRARDFDENLDIVTGLFDTLVLNVVGSENPLKPMVRNTDGTLNTEVNKLILDLWLEWSRSPTVCGQYTMLKTLSLACRSWLRDGEFLTRFARGKQSFLSDKAVPLALELIEADYLPFSKSEFENSNKPIIQGVEFNKYSQVKAFHILQELPDLYAPYTDSGNTKRVVVNDMLHLKNIRRVHQVRGVTILHSSLLRLDDLKDYEESERIAARVAAAWTAYIQKSGEQVGKTDASGNRTFEMSPGMIFDNLLPGETVGTIGSNRPNPELMPFRASMLRAVSAGAGVNNSTISREYNGTFSAQRQELLEAKPMYGFRRTDFIEMYLYPIYREFIKMGDVAGKLKLPEIDRKTLYNISVRGVDIGWIDPKKQADATETAILSGITTRGKVIRDAGGDPLEVFAEIQEEEKIFGPLPNLGTTTESTEEIDDEKEDQQDQE